MKKKKKEKTYYMFLSFPLQLKVIQLAAVLIET